MTKEEQAEKNRKACPITYEMLKEFREIFGEGVTVKKTTEKKNDNRGCNET